VPGRQPQRDLARFQGILMSLLGAVPGRLLPSGLKDLKRFADEFTAGIRSDKGVADLSMMRNPAAVSIFAIICCRAPSHPPWRARAAGR